MIALSFLLILIRKEKNMVNKIVTRAAKYALKRTKNRVANKVAEKVIEPYERMNRRLFGISDLNVGERETINCLQNPHNSLDYCKSVGNNVRRKYRKTGTY